MVLRLNPRYPLVWRTPHSIQFGIDRAIIRLDDVTLADERMISALGHGVSRPGLDVIAGAAGGSPADAVSLVQRLEPLLVRNVARSADSVVVEGSGPVARVVRDQLVAAGSTLEFDDGLPALAVIVADFVIDPQSHGRWLRHDVPHLPVVCGDSIVRIGPIVEPGLGPCLYCLELHHTDADPTWPAIATQVLGRRVSESASLTPLAVIEATAIAVRMVIARLESGSDESSDTSATSIDLDIATGERTARSWQRHPECGCAGLSADLPERAQSENARVSVRPRDPIRIEPRRDGAAAARA
jgi:bacteriocin biosynthesis cyclodehydratase domain-containing protein